MKYWISHWAAIRQLELIRFPEDFIVHSDFLKSMEKKELQAAFREIWNMFSSIYEDIKNYPEDYSLPLYEIEKYRFYDSHERRAREEVYIPLQFLCHLLSAGRLSKNTLEVQMQDLPALSTGKRYKVIIEKLKDFGFVMDSKSNLTDQQMTIAYPDNVNCLFLLKMMADKVVSADKVASADQTVKADEKRRMPYSKDFYQCHYRLLEEAEDTICFGRGIEAVADTFHSETERQFAVEFHKALKQSGYEEKLCGGWEGPAMDYGKKKGNSLFRISSHETRLILYLRIRNAKSCITYLEHCTEKVRDIFRYSDKGCSNRTNGTCNKAVVYEFEGENCWRCGCCNPAFYFEKPEVRDIPHYLKLVELGESKI
ncbi:hypothetical protein R2R35_23790 [Anaerocolumna sp. AGMB13020]|uniref:hypothetical protein n=1 Tax=Anaerocolumna sp. AGMB13020 TaxID=3081750 RepID=UPI002954A763|nr:hypothetical protein [Anaerocolumna sp. AGMB13020]WOO36775.1 hypothetical protein R2R35_23790 [Anaerocolumna sp. AGMB13020]